MSTLNNLIGQFTTPSASEGLFLSIEGIEGSGKTTQINFIKQFFEDKGYSVITLREPGGTRFGEKLREAILESTSPLHPLSEAHLFVSSRTQLLYEKILPALKDKKCVVILDRYIDSSLAYQGKARGLGFETILKLHLNSPLNILPKRTFFLDIDLETSMQRQLLRGNKKDYFESEKKDFYLSLVAGYREVASLFTNRVKRIDATVSAAEVSELIKADLETLL
jgi:dTMP kinase